jgi:hypothetical protein
MSIKIPSLLSREEERHVIRRLRKFSKLFRELFKGEAKTLATFAKNGSNQHGVYAISDTDDQIVYMGCTYDGGDGLRGRAKQHITANCKNDLNRMLGDRELAKNYFIRVAKISDYNQRRFAEYFGIAVYEPKLNKKFSLNR